MKVLVTGGAGLIGMAARKTLASRGHEVTAIDITNFGRDDPELILIGLAERAPLEKLMDDAGIEAIVHCGAISGPMLAKGQPSLLVSSNIDGTALLLDLARERNMRRFVFCSSISVYGNVGKAIITEERPLHPTSVYGATKVACEQLIEGFAVEYGLSGVSLRIARVYGPYRRANCYIGTMIRDADAGRMTEIACGADFPLHYVYVDDVAGALAVALEAEVEPGTAYNIGGPAALTMPEIAAVARRILPRARINIVPGKDDVPDVQTAFDLTLAKRKLGWAPTRDIAAGMLAYAEAIRAGQAA
jgi:UDP-glucuronate 4-epimerase